MHTLIHFMYIGAGLFLGYVAIKLIVFLCLVGLGFLASYFFS